jgi:hypothetical protein
VLCHSQWHAGPPINPQKDFVTTRGPMGTHQHDRAAAVQGPSQSHPRLLAAAQRLAVLPGLERIPIGPRRNVASQSAGLDHLQLFGSLSVSKKPELSPIIYWKRKVGTVTEKIGVENFRIGYDIRYFGFE